MAMVLRAGEVENPETSEVQSWSPQSALECGLKGITTVVKKWYKKCTLMLSRRRSAMGIIAKRGQNGA